MIAAWSAAFRSALPTTRTRSTATAPRGRAWPIPSPSSTNSAPDYKAHGKSPDRRWRPGLFVIWIQTRSVGADIDGAQAQAAACFDPLLLQAVIDTGEANAPRPRRISFQECFVGTRTG